MDTIENYNPFSKGKRDTHQQPEGQADKQQHTVPLFLKERQSGLQCVNGNSQPAQKLSPQQNSRPCCCAHILHLCLFQTAGEGEGVGWTFAPAAIEPMVAAVSSAVSLFREDPDKWRALQLRGMEQDVSWERAAQQYELVLTEAMVDSVQFAQK